jgi:tetratricopeptide (TPR) repeat protein
MSELLRASDPNASRRTLHDLLFETHLEFAIDRSSIPHTYDTDELLDYAEKTLRRRDMRGTEMHHQLLYRTGIAYCTTGSGDKGRELFEKGIRASDYPPDQALFRYAIGHWNHTLAGERREAKRVLLEARRQSERGRHLRTEIDLLLGSIHCGEGDGFAAQRRFERILNRGVLELRPMARIKNTRALIVQGLLDEAEAENARAEKMLEEPGFGDWLLRIACLENQAEIHMKRGEYEKALRVQGRVLEENHRRLHTDRLAIEYGNYALLCRRLGYLDEALEASLNAIRHASLKQGRIPIRLQRNLAILLNEMGHHGEALAAIDQCLDLSRKSRFRDFEFKSLVAAMDTLASIERTEPVPAILGRCGVLLDRHREDLPREALEEYVEVTARLGLVKAAGSRAREVKRLSSAADRAALAKRLGDAARTPNYERDLRQGIGGGMGFEDAPEPGPLARFLMLFAGDHFKSMSYQREFQKTQPRAKYHLQWLVNNGLLERLGTRKASTYILAFHRR